MQFLINDNFYDVEPDVPTSLLELLREQIHLTGTKKTCNRGACGACTVLMEGERVLPCLALAVQCEGMAARDVGEIFKV